MNEEQKDQGAEVSGDEMAKKRLVELKRKLIEGEERYKQVASRLTRERENETKRIEEREKWVGEVRSTVLKDSVASKWTRPKPSSPPCGVRLNLISYLDKAGIVHLLYNVI